MRKNIGWRHLLGGALAVGVTVSACQCYPDPELVVQPPKAIPAAARKVSGVFVDAKSGQLISKELSISVRDSKGAPVSGIKDPAGKSTNTFTINNGIVSFSVDPSKPLPLDLSIVARGTGYNSTSARVEITKDGSYSFAQKMVSLENPPEGVAAAQVTVGTADSSGTLPTESTIQTPSEANTGGTTEITIPAGTVVKAADGTPLTGELTATVSFYNNQDPSSLTAFPGGLNVAIPQTNGTVSEGTFISGGFTAVEITDSAGNVASTLSKPMDVKVSVPDTTINPATGAAVQAGETIPFWSYNEATGTWKAEGNATLAAGTNGLLEGTGNANHFSYFNLDWYGDRCSPARTVAISGNPKAFSLVMRFSRPGGGYVHEYTPWGQDPNHVETFNAPKQTQMKIEAFFQGNKVGETTVNDMCSTEGDIPLSVTMPNVQEATLKIHAQQACADNATITSPIPTATVVGYPVGGGNIVVTATDANGDAQLVGLVSGTTYDLYLYTPTGFEKQTKKLVAGENTVAFDQTVTCNVVSGANGGSGE